jgi:hypothetical protein
MGLQKTASWAPDLYFESARYQRMQKFQPSRVVPCARPTGRRYLNGCVASIRNGLFQL